MTPMDPTSQALGEVLDAETVQQLIDLDDGALGLIQEMFEIFREDTPSRIDALAVAAGANHREEIGDIAHAIKGAAATIGAPRVRALALALETAGRKGSSDPEPTILVASLREEFQSALKALEAFIASKR
jgi:HPt (histidine-containing phosphotransfer) domain-containing protein